MFAWSCYVVNPCLSSLFIHLVLLNNFCILHGQSNLTNFSMVVLDNWDALWWLFWYTNKKFSPLYLFIRNFSFIRYLRVLTFGMRSYFVSFFTDQDDPPDLKVCVPEPVCLWQALLFNLSINQLETPSKYTNKEGAACMYLWLPYFLI